MCFFQKRADKSKKVRYTIITKAKTFEKNHSFFNFVFSYTPFFLWYNLGKTYARCFFDKTANA